jgi:UDP-N-acetylglucosamine:LPS N-acetylglucosamine transferase
MRTTPRICLTASSGGHLSQLLKVAHSCGDRETFVVTTSEAVRADLARWGRVYVVGECNREHPLRVLGVLWRCARIVFQERPDVVISTGAAPGCLTCFLGKLIGAKVVWMDSITNVERLSLSGRMVRHIADLFLVQWPELARRYRGVQYVGAVI